MKFSIATVLLLAIAPFSCVSASPVASHYVPDRFEAPLLDADTLQARSTKYPVKSTDALIAKIMANLKANLHAKFCEKAAASLKVRANILGGLIKVEDIHIKAIESVAVKNFQASFDAKLSTKIQANIYDKLEVNLRKSCGVNRLLNEANLLNIVADLETKAKALINIELPKIGVDLGVKVKEELEIAVKGVEVNIPLILQIAIDIGINKRATLETCIDAALKVCAKLDTKASAKAILEAL